MLNIVPAVSALPPLEDELAADGVGWPAGLTEPVPPELLLPHAASPAAAITTDAASLTPRPVALVARG
jgi:hypothetical protein